MTELKLLQCRLDGRYDIEDCLGRGSYAEIYVARDRAATDERFRTVVVKALNVMLQGDQDPELERTLIQNFQNEATALDRVRHPNIISRLGHGTAIDLTSTPFHYIVLEYLSGGDLSALSRREALGLDRALFYLQQICAGLAHAHECGVIHRDIKPQNLLLTADHQTVKIADFGVQHPVGVPFFFQFRKLGIGRRRHAEHGRMRSSRRLAAHLHEIVKRRRRVGIGIVGRRDHDQKITLRRDALVIAVDRVQTVAQRVDARFDILTAAVRTTSGKSQRA